jgi:hypothetical protein
VLAGADNLCIYASMCVRACAGGSFVLASFRHGHLLRVGANGGGASIN